MALMLSKLDDLTNEYLPDNAYAFLETEDDMDEFVADANHDYLKYAVVYGWQGNGVYRDELRTKSIAVHKMDDSEIAKLSAELLSLADSFKNFANAIKPKT